MNEKIDDCWNREGVGGDRSCELLRTHAHCHNCDNYGLRAAQVMHRPLPEAYRREWAEHFAREERTHKETDQAALTFRIGREWLALPAVSVVAVAEQVQVRRLPHRATDVLQGIVSIRGRLYPCMSLAGLLDIDTAQPSAAPGPRVYPRLLAVQLQQHGFALPVDELDGIQRYAQAGLEEPPPANRALYRYITGILRTEKALVGCLDPELLGYKLASVLR